MNGYLRDNEILSVFWVTGHPTCDRPRLGVAVCVVEDTPWAVFYSERTSDTSCVHAEENLIRDLDRYFTKTKLFLVGMGDTLKIKVFQNYSPCWNCARLYCGILDTLRRRRLHVTLSIHFVCLYNISWDEADFTSASSYLDRETQEQNVEGLLRLRKQGVNLNTFAPNTWTYLRLVLGILGPYVHPRYLMRCSGILVNPRGRESADNKTADSLKKILSHSY